MTLAIVIAFFAGIAATQWVERTKANESENRRREHEWTLLGIRVNKWRARHDFESIDWPQFENYNEALTKLGKEAIEASRNVGSTGTYIPDKLKEISDLVGTSFVVLQRSADDYIQNLKKQEIFRHEQDEE